MRVFVTVLLSVVCIGILIFGNQHWKEKTDVKADVHFSDRIIIEMPESDAEIEDVTDEENVADEEKKSAEEQGKKDTLLSLTANWPKESQRKFAKALDEQQPFRLAIVGSSIGAKGSANWPALLSENIVTAYGEQTISVDVLTYDLTTESFVEDGKVKDITKLKPDLVLFEPFTLNDNGVVDVSDSTKFIDEIVKEVKGAGATVILQPPHPIEKASLYPKQVEALEKFADDKKIAFLNHWDAWPKPDSKEFKKHVKTKNDRTYPSKTGHQVWADFLTKHFIAE